MNEKVRWNVKDAGTLFIDAYNETTKTTICDGCGKSVVLIGRVIPPTILKLKMVKLSIDGKIRDEIDVSKIKSQLHCPYCDAILNHKTEQPKEVAMREAWGEAFSDLPKEERDKKRERGREMCIDGEILSKREEGIKKILESEEKGGGEC